jgi:DNA-binding IclR family transcriptional regulator
VPPEAFYVARTLQVLELLAFQPLSAPQVAATLQIHPRTARRVLVRLHEEGYLTRSDDTRRLYAPSMRIVALAGQVAARSPLAVRGLATVARLHDEAGAEAHLVVPSYLSALCIVHADGCGARPHPRELVPSHGTACGKALLAWRQRWRDSVLVHELQRHTERTLVDPAALSREADAIRTRGYATEDGEFEDGVRGVAAPVFVGDEAVAALGVSGPGVDIDGLAGRVVALADELTARMAPGDG